MQKIIILIYLLIPITLVAQEQSDVNKAADDATNPLAFVTKLQVQPNYTFMDNGGDQLLLVTRIIQPTKTIGLPFIKSKDQDRCKINSFIKTPDFQLIFQSQIIFRA
ncbi:MAG: hypothetical protein L3J34_10615 [Flavobacteriaceae bacterium]|nr:hypothetical protein [Flavobacteriaceae bacterium]